MTAPMLALIPFFGLVAEAAPCPMPSEVACDLVHASPTLEVYRARRPRPDRSLELARAGRLLKEELTRFSDELARRLPGVPRPRRLRVLLDSALSKYGAYYSSDFRTRDSRGRSWEGIRLLERLAVTDDAPLLVAHELVHSIQAAVAPSVPQWQLEGVAQLLVHLVFGRAPDAAMAAHLKNPESSLLGPYDGSPGSLSAYGQTLLLHAYYFRHRGQWAWLRKAIRGNGYDDLGRVYEDFSVARLVNASDPLTGDERYLILGSLPSVPVSAWDERGVLRLSPYSMRVFAFDGAITLPRAECPGTVSYKLLSWDESGAATVRDARAGAPASASGGGVHAFAAVCAGQH